MNNRSVWMRSKVLALVAGLALGLGGLLVAAGHAFSPSPAASFKLADANEGPSRIGFAPVRGFTSGAVRVGTETARWSGPAGPERGTHAAGRPQPDAGVPRRRVRGWGGIVDPHRGGDRTLAIFTAAGEASSEET